MSCVLLLPSVALANISADVATIKAIEKGRWSTAKKLILAQKNPVLDQLYLWRWMQDSRSNLSFQQRYDFIKSHPNWPQQPVLQERLELSIKPDDNQADILAYFKMRSPKTAEGVTAYAESLLRTGQHDAFKTMINEWWATTLMGRADQIFIYKRFGSHITEDAHRRRFDKLLYNRQYTNVRAVAKLLKHGYPQLAEARIALAEDKNGVDRLIEAVPDRLQSDPGLLYERLRWRRKRGLDTRAIEILNNPPPAEKNTNLKAWWHERHIIARRLMEKGQFKQAEALVAAHQQEKGFAYAQAQWLSGWLALKYRKKPDVAFQRFNALSKKVAMPVSVARAHYWIGKAALAMDKEAVAKGHFRKAARYQTVYYGQKAANHVSVPSVSAIMRAPFLTTQERSLFMGDPLIQAAWLYAKAGYKDIAEDFLYAFVWEQKNAKAQIFAVKQARHMKLFNALVKLSKQASQKGWFVTKHAYPTVSGLIKSANTSVDPALLHALMRQESQFDQYAKSPVGALGLMQLMPRTAKDVARKHRVRHYKQWLTKKPEHNVKLGALYMQDLLKRYDGDTVLAVAAYNAGPSRVRSWIRKFGDPRTDAVSHEDWAELIPVYETRNYIQRVHEGRFVYKALLP